MAENKQYDRVKEITDQLEEGISELFDSDRYREWLTTMSRFHDYSLNNTLLIAFQKPDATLVAGYTTWKNQFGRQVQKGQKGIRILAPTPYKKKVEKEKLDPDTKQPMKDADGNVITETQEITRAAFKVVNVFDVSQTEGRELPTLGVDEMTGDVQDFELFFEALKQTCPVPIAFEKIEGGAKGYYHQTEQRIAIQEGMSQLQTVKTAIHEMAHQKLHAIDPTAPGKQVKGEPGQSRNSKEVEAESVAYTICQKYGLDTSDYSFAYIAGWSAGKETPELKASLQTIRQASSEMITAIDKKMEQLRSIAKEKATDRSEEKGNSISYRLYQLRENLESKVPLHFMDMRYLQSRGLAVEGQNYALVYSGNTGKGNSTEEVLESLYERFNLHHPDDFRGHSLSVSDVIVLHEEGRDQAYYVDSFGFQQVPEFFASNPLEKVEELLEDDYGMIDGIINNGERGKEEKEEKSKSVRERLSEKKDEISKKDGCDVPLEKDKVPERSLS
ncbi:MAG: YodL domain-containing protein [Eubacteriales bacterium]|nr:YodL domain-containing protein [Eubacteriales bacterium]